MFDARPMLDLLEALERPSDERRLAEALAAPDISLALGSLGLSAPAAAGLLTPSTSAPGSTQLDGFGAYVERLRAAREPLESLARELAASGPELLRRAARRAGRFLPRTLDVEGVRAVFVPLALDCRTERDTVYIDPVAALALGSGGLEATLAHELHHIGRYRLTGENLTLMRTEASGRFRSVPDVGAYWSTWLEAEGIADAVSSVTDTDGPLLHEIVVRRRRELAEYRAMLRAGLLRLDRAHHDQGTDPAELDRLARELRSDAHPVGARMAESILRVDGEAVLRSCVGRPGRFVGRYAELPPSEDPVPIPEELLPSEE